MLEYTELMFAKNDHFHQEGNFTKQIAEVQPVLCRIISPFIGYMKLLINSTNLMKDRTKEESTLRRNSLTS